MPLTSHRALPPGPECEVCGRTGCRTHPATEFWFPDNLPKAGEMERRRKAEKEQPVSGDAARPTADGYLDQGRRPRRTRARTSRRSRWPEEDRMARRGEDR